MNGKEGTVMETALVKIEPKRSYTPAIVGLLATISMLLALKVIEAVLTTGQTVVAHATKKIEEKLP